MRKLYFIVASFLIFVQCKSIDKLVEQGRYDEAFELGIDKLAGKKDKETKYVKGLERAFAELNERDLYAIDAILAGPHDHLYDRVANIYINLDRRQQILKPILPLRSKDGYLAKFQFANYTQEIANAKEQSAIYDYNRAEELMVFAEKGDKSAAQRAFELYEDVSQYNPNFKDIKNRQDDAFEMGVEYFGIEFAANVPGYVREILLNDLSQLNPTRFNTFWTKYDFVDAYSEKDYDGTFVVTVDELDFGIEREVINNFNVEKKIIDGTRPVRDSLGRVVRDSLGRQITEPNHVFVDAQVKEIKREKISTLYGDVKFYSNRENYAASTNPIQVNFVFNDVAADYRGDKRALDNNILALTRKNLVAFPDQITTVRNLSDHFFREVSQKITRIRIGV